MMATQETDNTRPKVQHGLYVVLLMAGTVLALLAMLMTPCLLAADPSSWPEPHEEFFTALTYPQDQWDGENFGVSVAIEDQVLVERFRPRIHIYPGEFYPIDFYAAYLPHTVVRNAQGDILVPGPDRKYLKRIERDYGKYLDFTGDFDLLTLKQGTPQDAVLYPSVYRETLTLPNRAPTPVIVLKYSAVFAGSGLPGKIGFFRNLFVRATSDPRIWHELDIHGAVHLIIDRQTLEPLIVLLAQHNHFRTYLVGVDIEWPHDDRLSVSYALRSNEPYLTPVEATPAKRPTAGDPTHLRYILTGKPKPLTAGYDVIHGPNAGAREIPYQLVYLTTRDPLYTSWIPLGDKKKILGLFDSFYRTGPPGININTHPQIKDYTETAAAFYIQPDDSDALDLYEKHVKGFTDADYGPVLQYNKPIISDRLNRRAYACPLATFRQAP